MASLFSTLSVAKYETALLGQTGSVVDFSRNFICKMALEKSATHVCMIDTDMEFPPDTINRLLDLQKPVVGVASRKKIFPRQYTIEADEPAGARSINDEELPKDPFCRIGGYPILVGTGIMLIDLQKVNGIVAKPWFLFGTFWNDEEVGYTGEDIYFCRKVWKAGLEVWCDPTIEVKHIGDYEY
jgi:GT2 family glycosyltransferase